jgi:catechol 2,3-dioxygenase-like lactoylglutathione lyase family enzyme
MADERKPRMVGMNHVVLEVDDVEAALEFYGRIFEFSLRGRTETQAFIDMGDQFLVLAEGRSQPPDTKRHFGLVVDDRTRVSALAEAAGATMIGGSFLDFLDPWGNRVQVIGYGGIQFSKTDAVLQAMGLSLEKTEDAKEELRKKGVAV